MGQIGFAPSGTAAGRRIMGMGSGVDELQMILNRIARWRGETGIVGER